MNSQHGDDRVTATFWKVFKTQIHHCLIDPRVQHRAGRFSTIVSRSSANELIGVGIVRSVTPDLWARLKGTTINEKTSTQF